MNYSRRNNGYRSGFSAVPLKPDIMTIIMTNYSKEFVISTRGILLFYFFFRGGARVADESTESKQAKGSNCHPPLTVLITSSVSLRVSPAGADASPHISGEFLKNAHGERQKKGQLAALGLVCSFSHR